MNINILTPIVLVLLILTSCATIVSTSVKNSYPALDNQAEVKLIEIQDRIPAKAEDLGDTEINDNGQKENCSYNWSIETAKTEARKVGGNAIKVMEYHYYNEPGVKCNTIISKIFKVEDFNNFYLTKSDSLLEKADYALLHIYRTFGAGFLITYEIQLGDSVICYASSGWKETIKIRRYGRDTLRSWTETNEQLPIDIKKGKEYYVRSSLTMGMIVGHPRLELVAKEIGKEEFDSIDYTSKTSPTGSTNDTKKVNDKDVIYLNDGRKYTCTITSEDNENVYFTIIKNDEKVKTNVAKTNIKKIKKRD